MAYELTDEDWLLARQMAAQRDAMAATAKPKNAGMLGDILSTVGGIGGSILGSFAAPVAGTIGGGAIGSGLGRGLANLLTGTKLDDQVVADTALGGVGGVLGKFMKVGGAGAKVAADAGQAVGAVAPKSGVLSGFRNMAGNAIENSGNKLMASQANLTRAQARNLGEPLSDTFGSLQKRTGIGNMDDLSRIGSDVTGKNGVVPEFVNKSVSPLSIDMGDISKVADRALQNNAPGVFGAQRKALTENVKNSVTQAYGGADGSLSSVVGGKTALTTSKDFAERAATYRDAFKRTGNATDKQVATVYQELSNTINDRLYSAPGAQELFLTKGKPEVVRSFRAAAKASLEDGDKAAAKAYTRLAGEFQSKVTNIADARTFQKDFVQLSKIAEKTAQAENGAAFQLAGARSGLGKFAQNPLNIIAEPLNAQSGKVGSKMADFGRYLKGEATPVDAATAAGSGGAGMFTKKNLVKALIAQGVPRAVAGNMLGGDANAQLSPEALAAMGTDPSTLGAEDLASLGLGGGTGGSSAGGAGLAGAPGAIDPESLNNAIFDAAKRGDDKSVTMLLKLADFYYPTASGGATSNTANKSLMATSNALNSVQQLEALLEQTGGQDNGLLANIFGGIQNAAGNAGLDDNARTYNDIAGSLVTPLARAISGETGQLSDQDIKRAQGMLPKLTDSAAVRKAKLENIYASIQSAQSNARSFGGSGGTDLAAMFGGM